MKIKKCSCGNLISSIKVKGKYFVEVIKNGCSLCRKRICSCDVKHGCACNVCGGK
jgi:hypothetical protein